MTTPLVAIVADTLVSDSYVWHATPYTYLDAVVEIAGLQPLIVPAFGDATSFEAILDAVHGVMLTGARSNMHPDNYGIEPTEAHGPFDPARDATSLPLIRHALKRDLPLLAICRGHQELNVALGGSLANDIQEGTGRSDHRAPQAETQDERYVIREKVAIAEGSQLQSWLGAKHLMVNSLHRQAVDRVADGLAVEAEAADGTVEAVRVRDAKNFAYGFQWHPEYWARSDATSRAIFEAFGDAVREYAMSRRN